MKETARDCAQHDATAVAGQTRFTPTRHTLGFRSNRPYPLSSVTAGPAWNNLIAHYDRKRPDSRFVPVRRLVDVALLVRRIFNDP